MPDLGDMGDRTAPAGLRPLGRVGFIGAGALGSTLARALAGCGAQVIAVTARRPDRAVALANSIPGCRHLPGASDVAAAADTVFLAVPDDALAAVDAALAWSPHHTVVHLSGARGLDILPHAAVTGANVAALHPLMIFPRPAPTGQAALARLSGCTWALAASDADTRARLETLVAALGGRAVLLPDAARVPYHLSAVMASNYVVALLGAAVDIWQTFGIDSRVALDALVPLLRATVENLAALGPAGALAGPVARGDVGTVAAHLAWLQRSLSSEQDAALADPAALIDAYRALARLAIPLAQARGSLTDDAADALRRVVDAGD